MTDHLTPIRGVRPSLGTLVTLLSVAVGATFLFSGAGPAHANIGGVSPTPEVPVVTPVPAEEITAKRKKVLRLARREVARKVRERERNVPRYRNGRGRIAPYSISDQWCAAFATWIWGRAGFDDFRRGDPRPQYLWTSQNGAKVAVQVEDLRTWAKRTKRHTVYATEGDLVAYEGKHIGIVMQVNRERRAIRAIEGNKSDRVRWVNIPMKEVIDYFHPVPIPAAEKSTRSLIRPDVG